MRQGEQEKCKGPQGSYGLERVDPLKNACTTPPKDHQTTSETQEEDGKNGVTQDTLVLEKGNPLEKNSRKISSPKYNQNTPTQEKDE